MVRLTLMVRIGIDCGVDASGTIGVATEVDTGADTGVDVLLVVSSVVWLMALLTLVAAMPAMGVDAVEMSQAMALATLATLATLALVTLTFPELVAGVVLVASAMSLVVLGICVLLELGQREFLAGFLTLVTNSMSRHGAVDGRMEILEEIGQHRGQQRAGLMFKPAKLFCRPAEPCFEPVIKGTCEK